jgi:hypothetical protein
MTREEKIKLAIEKGFTYDEVSGKIFSRFGKEITKKINGYIIISLYLDKKRYYLLGHQFVYYYNYGRVVNQIDHKDGDRTNNKINNLREVNNQQNQQNRTKAKGYYFDKTTNKFCAHIGLNSKSINLGRYNTEGEARQAYLDAKKIYHII